MRSLTIQPAAEAYETVLASAGATRPKRDAVDERVIEMVRTGRAHHEAGGRSRGRTASASATPTT